MLIKTCRHIDVSNKEKAGATMYITTINIMLLIYTYRINLNVEVKDCNVFVMQLLENLRCSLQAKKD